MKLFIPEFKAVEVQNVWNITKTLWITWMIYIECIFQINKKKRFMHYSAEAYILCSNSQRGCPTEYNQPNGLLFSHMDGCGSHLTGGSHWHTDKIIYCRYSASRFSPDSCRKIQFTRVATLTWGNQESNPKTSDPKVEWLPSDYDVTTTTTKNKNKNRPS